MRFSLIQATLNEHFSPSQRAKAIRINHNVSGTIQLFEVNTSEKVYSGKHEYKALVNKCFFSNNWLCTTHKRCAW